MKKITTVLLAAFLLLSFNGFSQELVPVNFNTRVSNSQLIVEGKVISKRSFWDNNNYNIYTASKIEVYKVFKGNLYTNFIEIITPGGIVGLHKEEVHPSLELENNDVGVFMLHNNTILTYKVNGIPLYQPYASVQGFVKYDLAENKAASVFDKFNNIDQVLYNTITGLTNTNFIVVKPYTVKQNNSSNKATPTISNFNPTTVTAGTGTQITINGNNFGASAGTVSFSDANDGGSTFYPALATQIISWNNTQIVVEVPSRGGTGPIRVTNTDPASVTSGSNLTVSYAEINVDFDPGTGTESYQTQHIDDDANGGYTWQMFTDFDANASAKASFIRAFNSWTSCSGTKINWTIGAVTSTDVVANDGINIIRDDNGAELPNGVLGRCTSRFSGCGGPTIKWFVSELDIAFDDGANWNYGPAAPGFTEYDFETVAVHELGHGHQLGHVISPGAIMHFSVTNGTQNRTPGVNDLAGGNDVMSRSTVTAVCGEGVMTAMVCGSAPVADFSGNPTTLCENSTVTYTDLSTNTPTGWSWSFPGGTPNSSTAQNPTITYATAGTYNVTLTATNAFGSDPETKTNYITVNSCGSAPVADFSGTPTTLCENSTVTYTDLSTNTPTGWSWSFPGGTPSTSTAQNPTVTYANAGTYNVTLTATNAFGNDGETKTTYITVNACPSTIIWPGYCNITVPDLGYQLYAKGVPGGAQEYTYRAIEQASNDTLYFVYNSNRVKMEWFPGIKYSKTYALAIKAKKNGIYGDYSTASCLITTPDLPLTNLRAVDCNVSIPSFQYEMRANAVKFATLYEFRLTPQGGGSTLYFSNSVYKMRLAWVGGVLLSKNYDVDVRSFKDGVYSPYGPICQITTPSTSARMIFDEEEETNSIILNFVNNLDVTIYPNPNQGDFIYLDVNGLDANSQFIVTDISGKIVQQQQIDSNSENYNGTIRFNEKLNSGFYFVTIVSGNQKITKKLVVR